MAEDEISPAERVLRSHLESGRFRSGVAYGWWRLVSLSWPYLTVGVTARDGIEYGFRFHCVDYARTPVTAQPWDLDADRPLPGDRWPGGRARIPKIFNPGWKDGTCLYLPCDRQSIEGHGHWKNKYPELLWDPEKGVCKYLRILHDLLHSNDYEGRRAA